VTVTAAQFSDFVGYTPTEEAEVTRIEVLLDRARRSLASELRLPDPLAGDDELDYRDAVCELAHLYLEAEKAGAMEILALPVSQLSLGTLFWTKASGGFTATMSNLPTVSRVLSRWGLGYVRRQKIVLEGELDYPE